MPSPHFTVIVVVPVVGAVCGGGKIPAGADAGIAWRIVGSIYNGRFKNDSGLKALRAAALAAVA